MRLWLIAVAALGLGAVWSPQARAHRPFFGEMTCPVGGESFTYITSAYLTDFGQRPDSIAFGSRLAPTQIPMCPTNGLAMYREFTPSELERLPALIQSEAYRALAVEGDYAQAAWLELNLAPTNRSRIDLVIQSTWIPSDNPYRPNRLRELVSVARELQISPNDPEWTDKVILVANAQRELGLFEEALVNLYAIRQQFDSPPEGGDPDEKQRFEYRRAHIDTMIMLTAAGETSAEPIETMPVPIAAGFCKDSAGQPGFDPRGYCASDTLRERFEQMRATLEQREQLQRELEQ